MNAAPATVLLENQAVEDELSLEIIVVPTAVRLT
jgi:hypothetical protein